MRHFQQTWIVLIFFPLLLIAPRIRGEDKPFAGSITPELVAAFRAAVENDSRTPALINAISQNEVKKLALSLDLQRIHDAYYTNRLKTGDITNQRSSGRCWLFAGLNILRPQVIAKYNLSTFEFSQNYSFFWDKLEKANLFLEGMLGTLDRSVDDRLVVHLLKNPIDDGGQWNMVVDLIAKYGVVPYAVMPDTRHSSATGELNGLLSQLLRKYAAELRRLHEEQKKGLDELRQRKVAMLSDIHRILCYHFGEPPASFRWRFQDKDEKLGEAKTYTPQQFYAEAVGADLSQYVILYSCPVYPYGKLYRIDFDRDVFERPSMTFANVEIGLVRDLSLKQLLAGEPVWFGCDVGKEHHGESGMLRTGIFDYPSLLGVDPRLSKKERILYQDSIPSHAMVFQGVDLDGGKPVKWRVENSWGAEKGDKGYLSMYDGWFDEYLYAVIIHKKYLPEEVRKIFDMEAVTLPPWDPMFELVRGTGT